MGSLTLVLVSDYLGGGSDHDSPDSGNVAADNSFGLFEGNGQTVDYLAAAVIINNGALTYGGYYFPYIEQNNMDIGGGRSEIDMALALYSAYVQWKTSDYM